MSATHIPCCVSAASTPFDLCHLTLSIENLFGLRIKLRCVRRSRLGCQIILSKELEGMRLRVPSATRNFYVDGHVPEPH
eukprot:SAG31_NODE_2618_length_5366_cov_2.137650_6_plen_79_part_00